MGVGAWMPLPPGRMTAPFKDRQRGTLMPHKHNTKGRHHISKMRYVLTNWPQYEAGLRRRGSLMLWITQDAIDAWAATRRPTPGGQPIYSDSAIQPCLMLRTAFELALRQAEGLTLSVVELLRCELALPDQTIVSRRAAGLESITCGPLPRGPLHVLIDSTGLKVFGAGQWLSEKHMHSRRQ